MIRNNIHKYSVSAMCKVLQILRRRIARIMKQEGLVSNDTTAQFKPHVDKCNESKVANLVNREFDNRRHLNAVVSDLTYVRVGRNWNYICVLVDLFHQEIICYSSGHHKTARLVTQAFSTVKASLTNIEIFHTDRGNEFKNQLIDDALQAFGIQRLLSIKGCPYDNAVAEAAFKIIMTEFVHGQTFENMASLKLQIADYVNWFNNRKRSINRCKKRKGRSKHFKCGLRPLFQLAFLCGNN